MQLKINIIPKLQIKLDYLSSEYDFEIAGYLLGEIRNNKIYLKDLLIPNQVVTSTSINITPQDQLDLRLKYGNKVKHIIGHWHSHHSLGCFWSDTDERCMENIMSYKDFFVFIVSSNKEHLIRVMQNKPFKYSFDNCKLVVNSLDIELLNRRIKNIFHKK